MRLCDNCYKRWWVAKIDPKTGLQVVHKNGLRVFKCANCGNVQEEEKLFVQPSGEISANILYIDIEMSKAITGIYSLRTEYIHHSNIIAPQFMISWAASYMGSKTVFSDCVTPSEAKKQNDKRILKQLFELMQAADVWAGHNFDNFDRKHIQARFDVNGFPAVAKKRTLDSLKIARQNMKHLSNALDYLGGVYGIGGKDHVDNNDWMAVLQGDKKTLEKIHTYNRKDVTNGKLLLHRLMPYARKDRSFGSTK